MERRREPRGGVSCVIMSASASRGIVACRLGVGPVPDLRVAATDTADPAFMTAAKPDVLLLDVGLARDDSLSVRAALRKHDPATTIIMMDLIPMHEGIVQFVNAGLSGLVLKDTTDVKFVATIGFVAAGDKVLRPLMAESLFSQIVKPAETVTTADVPDGVHTTRRAREVIELIGDGPSSKEIAGNS